MAAAYATSVLSEPCEPAALLVTSVCYGYSDGYMGTNRDTRTIRCAYCSETRTMPSTRGPAPKYCSQAHRQAAYRERMAEKRELTPAQPSLREEVETLRTALERASRAKSWAEARDALSAALRKNRRSTK